MVEEIRTITTLSNIILNQNTIILNRIMDPPVLPAVPQVQDMVRRVRVSPHRFLLVLTQDPSLRVNRKDQEAAAAFGQAFDEIVVESHLTVRRKSNGRQARTQNVTNEGTGIIKTKREIKFPLNSHQIGEHHKLQRNPQTLLAFPPKQFGGSAANSQAQTFNSAGPLGSFGASAAASQTQSFGLGPNGLTGGAGFSGTQQYKFNGQTIDIAFGNAFSGNGAKTGGAVVTVSGPDGKKRPLHG
ncbi:hypothetical protein BDFB_002747 [Asbolus verrucosus]|uniref:Uncharacterized protein n=1 Tax=Asbolus verrucosus TaxID=1661398 RepID=A0A482V691_ASBVE|nr:hypothetical protein BDFB_002747 [Asbolus verrucosus]